MRLGAYSRGVPMVSRSGIVPHWRELDPQKRGETTLALRSCPRCGGDLRKSVDWYGDFEHCVQCGYYPPPISLSPTPN